VNFKYDKTTMNASHPWIAFLQKVTNLDVQTIGRIAIEEVHFTMPKMPATKKTDWVKLPHVTIESTTGKKIHWYIWKRKLDTELRTEFIGGQNRQMRDANAGEKPLVERVLADATEQGWLNG